MSAATAALVQGLVDQLRVNPFGMHGLGHWARVLENGRRLAGETGADTRVTDLFAVFHDAGRYSEGTDFDHGARGAELARGLRGVAFDLGDADMARLTIACELHSDGLTAHEDPTVMTCWDADRLDLGRVGIRTNPRYLCTEVARDAEVLEWARTRSRSLEVPSLVQESWGILAPG